MTWEKASPVEVKVASSTPQMRAPSAKKQEPTEQGSGE
jgi:hypothetical protein